MGSTDRACPDCSIFPSGEQPCPSCDGDGYHWDDDMGKLGCMRCRGRGYVSCDTCDGGGYLSTAELRSILLERDPDLSPAEMLREMGFTPLEVASA